jgi:hypothetical protein
MNMRAMMLTGIKEVHRDDDTIEHGNNSHRMMTSAQDFFANYSSRLWSK